MAAPEFHDGTWLRRQLKRWFSKHRRDLPWRRTTDPYRIWISEIMLQQTQVATVVDYYHRFLERFPDVHALATAVEQEVLEHWAGLGYYRRARDCHRAARRIALEYAGEFPKDLEELQNLPGIGRYTAGAIASFAFDQRAPILETNTARLLSRFLALTDPVETSSSQRVLWQFAEWILPARGGSGIINQSLMELGSLICLPKNPRCGQCPIRERCRAFQRNLIDHIPARKSSKPKQALIHVGLLSRDKRGRILLRCNPPGRWWAGLWDLPWVEWNHPGGMPIESTCRSTIEREFHEHLGLRCKLNARFQTIHHGVTRYRIAYHCFTAELSEDSAIQGGAWKWSLPDQLPATVARLRKLQLDRT